MYVINTMKLALQIYGQLRTFKDCIPNILNFIDYYNKDFDVFLFIDDGHSSDYTHINGYHNYSEQNVELLKHMLISERIKTIIYVKNMNETDIKIEQQLVDNYIGYHNKFEEKYGKLEMNIFTPRLFYRKYLLNEIRKTYETQNNITYDYIVRTRFDIKTCIPTDFTFEYIPKNVPVLCSDILTISSPEFMNIESLCGINYPITPKVCFDEDCKLIIEKYEKYKNWKGDKFWDNIWIFMPELNLRLYILEQGYTFIEAWWLNYRNYGFKIKR